MSRRVLSAVFFFSLGLSACASVNKQCFGDGVCRTETDGKVAWDGPPEKVAEYQAREEAEKKAAAERDAAFASAESRPAGEPIRVVIIGPQAGSPGTQPFLLQYRSMFMDAMQGDPRVQLVDAGRLAHLVQKKSSPGFSSRNAAVVDTVDAAMARRVRDGSGDVDVVVVVTAREKERTGAVRGGGGVGAARVVNIEFVASLSSVYAFDEQKKSELGDSNAGIVLGGIDKSGKTQKGELKGNRDPNKDREAIGQLASWVKSTVSGPVASTLPSLTAVQRINESLKQQQAGQLLQLMQGAKKQEPPPEQPATP